jgi:hypothetical protein
LPAIIPPSGRKNDYHYAYLNSGVPNLTIISEPFKPTRLILAKNLLREFKSPQDFGLIDSVKLVVVAREVEASNRRLTDMFFKNAALAVLP